MNKLLPFLKLLAIIFVLLILLLFIYSVTYQKQIVNEIKYKEQFANAYAIDPSLTNPILPALDPSMVTSTYNEANKQSNIASQIKNGAISNLNSWNDFNDKRETNQNSVKAIINDTKDGVKKFTGNLATINQKLYTMRNGDKDAAADIDKVGTFDATLFL